MCNESNPARAALLIDGDNISATHAAQLLAAAPDAAVARVYADPTHQKGWATQSAFELRGVEQGKNAADILLVIEAMELALAGGVTRMTIASSDADFRSLALRLRAMGCIVTGCGTLGTPESFRKACTRFVYLVDLGPVVPTEAPPPGSNEFNALLGLLIREAGPDGMRLSDLGTYMLRHHAVTKSMLPQGGWHLYLEAQGGLFSINNADGPARVATSS
ncbi:NYN domain-containing protein [Vannielia litorea]|uniref:NYN domain-containing protein n=1 Tax=Vannielia litorea TaxID=1217970 RepID=A0A1N6II36_9RHOB|nr:NYN domain-containing protein [Vannielia litorea]SIO31694.1 NYN domain-containing protein [Vannielia litorea]